mmetsp:Transcript_3813/g.4396  ORF Transcript_3813/g.4396 Transcript_3813/m.4396 type:complete len:233 (+) Transcript_3813:231-929(+)
MVFLLFMFNDPWYPWHVYKPSFLTFAFTEFTNSIFYAALLTFWLRELAGFRPQKAKAEWNCLQKTVYTGQGVNSCAVAYIVCFFIVIVVDFMVLNCFYYINVRGDPSLAGRFDLNSNDTIGDKFLWPIIITVILLIFYYAQYTMALSMGCTRLSDDKVPKARKVGFVTGIIVHFFFIFCVLFGVFNRHFANGGIQLLAYTILNLYVFLLAILNWPIKTYRREYELDDDQERL